MKSIDMPHSWHMCIVNMQNFAFFLLQKREEKEKAFAKKENNLKKIFVENELTEPFKAQRICIKIDLYGKIGNLFARHVDDTNTKTKLCMLQLKVDESRFF